MYIKEGLSWEMIESNLNVSNENIENLNLLDNLVYSLVYIYIFLQLENWPMPFSDGPHC